MAIGLTDPDVDVSAYREHNRQTDMFIKLEKNLCCEVFDGTREERGAEAAGILLTDFESYLWTKRIFARLGFSNNADTSMPMVNRRFNVLEYSY